MAENQLWKKPKDIEGNLQWKNGLIWRDVYFQVSANTIYLYPKNRKVSNQVLKKISFTQIEEIDFETKFLRQYFKIILKTGITEQFKCLNMESLELQHWIDNLRHGLKFWTDKENLKERKGRQRGVTMEESDEPSKSLNQKQHRVFFTLWNGEMLGLLVNATSTFSDIYLRLFSFACETSSCSVCKIRHQSCDLWAIDTSGTVRRVKKDEILADLEKAGNHLFVMEHHQKLLVVHFSDFSYESLPAPSSITATQVLKLDQIASKLNELGCFDPGLFLREESGNELQFCMNDNPFKFYERGKIVARSKRIKTNSVKKSDYEKIAELRWKEYRRFFVNQKTSDALRKSHADQIQKSCNMDGELCFYDDHFALNDDEMERGMQAQCRQRVPKHREECRLPKPDQYRTKSGGNDVNNDGRFRTNVTCIPSDPTCSGSNIVRQISLDGDWVSVHNDAGTSSNDGVCAENKNHITNSVKNEFNVSMTRSSSNHSFADSNQDISNKASPGEVSIENSNDVTSEEQSTINAKATSDTSHTLGESNHDLSSEVLQDGSKTNRNDDVANYIESSVNTGATSEASYDSLCESNRDLSNGTLPGVTTTKNTNDDVTNFVESAVDTTATEASHSLAESSQDIPNKASPDDVPDATTPNDLSSSCNFDTSLQDVSSMVSPGDCSSSGNNDVSNLGESAVDSGAPRDLSSNYNRANNDQDLSNKSSRDNTCAKNSSNATVLTDNSVDASITSGSSHHRFDKCVQGLSNKSSPPDVPNLVESNTDACIRRDSNYNTSKGDQDQSNKVSSSGTRINNNNDLIVSSNHQNNRNETPDVVTNTPSPRDCSMASNHETNVIKTVDNANSIDVLKVTGDVCVENTGDLKEVTSIGHNMVEDVHKSTNREHVNSLSTESNRTDVKCPLNNSLLGPNTSSSPSVSTLIHSKSDGSIKDRPCDKRKLSHSSENRIGMRRSLSDLNIRYSFTSDRTRDTRSMSESDLLEKDEGAQVGDVYAPDNSERDVFIPKVSTLTGPTWTFAKKVEGCVGKILAVREDISEVERLIAVELCEVLFELLNHGLKKSLLGISLFASATNVWTICQIVCKETKVAAGEIERIKEGSIGEKFHLFIRECIRKKMLSRWFEVLSTEKVQKRIMKHYEHNAAVLEPEHSKAMEHLKLHLDQLVVLKLKVLKPRQSPQNRPTLLLLE